MPQARADAGYFGPLRDLTAGPETELDFAADGEGGWIASITSVGVVSRSMRSSAARTAWSMISIALPDQELPSALAHVPERAGARERLQRTGALLDRHHRGGRLQRMLGKHPLERAAAGQALARRATANARAPSTPAS